MRIRTIATIAAAIVNVALIQPASAAEKPTPEQIAKREAECKARPYHTWVAPHAAGQINPKTQQVYKRDTFGSCRVDSKAVKAAVDAGKLTK